MKRTRKLNRRKKSIRFKVHMLAIKEKGQIRIVDVPEEEILKALTSNDILNLVSDHGQKPLGKRVETGDVVEYDNRYFEVAMAGYREISKKKFDRLEGKRTERMDIS